MARPQIEFIQSQNLPWVPDTRIGIGDGVEIKVLSEDDETGAASLLVRYPAGWTFPAGASGADEEFLVLDGELRVGNFLFRHLGYAHWPAGHVSAERASRAGAAGVPFTPHDPPRPPPPTLARPR